MADAQGEELRRLQALRAGCRVSRRRATARATLDLPGDDGAPARARRMVGDFLHAWRIEDGDVRAGALVVISELVTNAIVHGGGHVSLEVDCDRDRLRLSVLDGSSAVPQPRGPRQLEGHGRGLRLVQAMSTRWGVDSRPPGKRVWAELDLT